MAYRDGGCENIWLAWDGEDQAVLGYFCSKGEELIKHRKGAIVLCHLKPAAYREGNRSGIVVDVFSIGPGENFLRTLRLPRDTHSVELLIDDGQAARPLKAFELARETDGILPEARYGNVVIALPEDEGDEPDARFVWSDKRIHHVKKPNAHIGWAGYFTSWPIHEGDSTGNVVAVSSFRLEVPHLEDALQIFPVGYDITEAEFAARDDTATAIMRASVENDRVQNAVLTIEGSRPLLQGLYFLHVSAHRQRANEWSEIIDIDPGTFQSISDNLVDAYRQLLSGTGDWDDAEVGNAGQNLIELLTQEHRWFELSSPDYFVDVVPNETGEKVKLSAYEISAGDHLVFYDTMGRKLRAGQHLSSDSILAFKANTTGLQLLRGIYTTSHKKIAEIDAHRPAKRSSQSDAGKFESLPAALSANHDWVGAPHSPFDFTPLKVHSALYNGLGNAEGAFAWETFIRDPAAWFLADSINPNFWISQADFRAVREGNILVRALSLLGREEAFVALPQLEDQLVAAFLVMRLARTPVLHSCIYRINGISPANDDLPTLAEMVNGIDERLSNGEFREWLSYSQPQMHEMLCEPNGTSKPIDRGALKQLSEELRHAAEVFDAFHGALGESAKRPKQVVAEGVRWQPQGVSDDALENLIASLTESDLARDKFAGQQYEALLGRFGRNAYYRSRIAADIYKNYPDLLPNDSKKLMEFLRGLLTESGCNFDMRNFDEKLVDSVAENMQNVEAWLLPNAVNMRKMAQVELDNASMNTPTDEKKKAAIIEFAAAHEMQKTWDDISDIIVRAETAGIRVPTKLRRLQLLWPRESSTTLSEFLTFEHKHKHILGQALSETYGYDSILYA
ncbi:hypothetical protein PZ897_19295 [Hoeflea sp. YIM 152468]|uniref:hypothetical protein n=1 Tax=Hoeflea sp. YIM 152468 TaxID=3031759 RepID=UPI0023DC0C5B|nr:hypothetical protein [Hoeflea sp. YIM 152468]MDF1610332.1 hypothetical protein [Hoeflea sp. YIM 152468]